MVRMIEILADMVHLTVEVAVSNINRVRDSHRIHPGVVVVVNMEMGMVIDAAIITIMVLEDLTELSVVVSPSLPTKSPW